MFLPLAVIGLAWVSIPDLPRRAAYVRACARMDGGAPSLPSLPSLEEVRAATADFRLAVQAVAPPLCDAIERDDPAVGPLLKELFATSDGVRGFFVNYLTDPTLSKPDAAEPPRALLDAMSTAPAAMLSELMVMNVVMPSATSMVHLRNGDEEQAAGSRLTARRASALVSSGNIESVRGDMLAVLAVCEGNGPCTVVPEERLVYWSQFCDRWKYDEVQRQMIAMVMKALTGHDD